MRNHSVNVLLTLLTIGCGFLFNLRSVAAQEPSRWPPQQQIPYFHPENEPPILVTDQNRTVHAFSSQWFDEEGGEGEYAIIYNQWTLQGGWTKPNDILLSPLYNDARVMGVVLDQRGIFHLIFIGGHDIEARVYYSKAPATAAANATVWSPPVIVGDDAITPRGVGLALDGEGRLVMIYTGNRDGIGIYATHSLDYGDTWVDPVPLFLTDSLQLKPFSLRISVGASGWLHATWNTVSANGQGRGIYYTRTRLADEYIWEQPTTLATSSGGLGVMTPTIIEHQDLVFALYNETPKITMRRSNDSGETWTNPIQIFNRHVGVNGSLSVAADANKTLHLFFGQRITGNPDIHGMWHSIWQGGSWSEPEPVVSGPQVNDIETDKAFDPYDARAVVSQGNVILATWRSDPGNKGNGVWYSHMTLNAPEASVQALPLFVPTPLPLPTATQLPATATPEGEQQPIQVPMAQDNTNRTVGNTPAMPVLVGLTPVLLFLIFIAMRNVRHHSKPR
jgi:hypothetical protein